MSDMTEKSDATKKILSIDGGGIRGIIPAVVLAEIEKRTDRRISELFDLIAGTSAGGILALGLTMPGPNGQPKYGAKELIELFQRDGKQIFAPPSPPVISHVKNVLGARHPAQGIEAVLQEYFDEARLSDALTKVLVTSYDIERRAPFFFKSTRAKKRESHDFPIWQVARATSAAPTYFEPLKIKAKEASSDYYALVDGGVFANNPAMCAYSEARELNANANGSQVRTQDYLVVSLGTGELTRPLFYEQEGFWGTFSNGWGLMKWAQQIVNVVFDGVAETVDHQMNQMLPENNGYQQYYRFQRLLQHGNDALDDDSNKNLRALWLLAQKIVDENDELLDKLCERLVARQPPLEHNELGNTDS